MGYVPYVGFVTHHHATMRIHLQFKRLMIKQMICKKKKKKKKKIGRHNCPSVWTVALRLHVITIIRL
jgi:hypothetical protein